MRTLHHFHHLARLLLPWVAPLLMASPWPWAHAQATAQAMAEEAPDETFSESELQRGKRSNRAECDATSHAVWVEYAGGDACIRYFPSSNVQGAKTAAFFFNGDNLDGRFIIPGSYANNKASAMLKMAQSLSNVNRVPYIVVARPGTYGSSGRHDMRRLPEEYLAMNAAVSAIKARHGIEHVHLAGQSGGAAVVGALLTLGRTDVACAAASSGPFDALGRAREQAANRSTSWNGCDSHGVCGPYNVTDHVAKVAASTTRRIFLVGDPQDTNTAFRFQKAFAEKLAAAGHTVQLLEGQAVGPQRHGLAHMANRVVGWCNAGFDDERIGELVRGNAVGLGAAVPQAAQGGTQ